MGVSVQFSNKSQAARPRVSLFVLRRGLIPGWCWCRHRLADLHIDRYVRIRKWVHRGIDLAMSEYSLPGGAISGAVRGLAGCSPVPWL